MTAGCDYANARVQCTRGRLLGPNGIMNLLAQPGLQSRLELLKRTDYGAELAAHLAREADPLAAAEHALRARLINDLAQIDRFLAGEKAQALFRAVLAIEDGWSLKTVMRAVAAGETPERTITLVVSTRELDHPALEELVRQRNVKAIVDLLVSWHSTYAQPLQQALPEYVSHRDLTHLEVALDRFLYGRVLETAQRDDEDSRIVRRFIEAQIDLVNAATLLKQAGHGGAEEFFIAGGRVLQYRRFQRYAALDLPSLRGALTLDARLFAIRGLSALASLEQPAATDQFLHRVLVETIRREARENPLSLAVPLAFVFERQAEIRRIRLVLRGGEFGVPASELIPLVEAAGGHP
jgi:V/A-type H+/Na+-transporting ATPase subunit C